MQQAQQAHIARLLPQGERPGHAHQVVAKRAGLVPVLPHVAGQHGGQHGGQVGVPGQPLFVQHWQGAGQQFGVQGMKGQAHERCLRRSVGRSVYKTAWCKYRGLALCAGLAWILEHQNMSKNGL
ncbi:hypothetical protein D3C72_2062370 [compost metagenome]